jgi:hypothetical protein
MYRMKRHVPQREGRPGHMSDLSELEELRAFAPPPPIRPLTPERFVRQKEAVMREVVRSAKANPSMSRPKHAVPRNRRRLAIPIAAALVVLVGAAAAWTLVASSGRDSVALQCEIEGTDAIIPAVSGDPVSDCAAQWKRESGSDAPRLVAYDNGVGGITVLPADEKPPSGFTALHAGVSQNVAMIQMQQWLDDHVAGLSSDCYDTPTAMQMTQQELERLGMAGWTVQPPPSTDHGRCVGTGILDAATTTVSLRAMGGQLPASSDVERLAVELRSIAQDCAPLDTVARQVRSAASRLGLSEDAHDYELTEVKDDSAPCTTIDENVGGTIFLILRGPSGS